MGVHRSLIRERRRKRKNWRKACKLWTKLLDNKEAYNEFITRIHQPSYKPNKAHKLILEQILNPEKQILQREHL